MNLGPDVPPDPPRKRIPTPNFLLAVRPAGNRFYRLELNFSDGMVVEYAEPPAENPDDFIDGLRAKRKLEEDAVRYGFEHVRRESTPWCVENYGFTVGGDSR